MDRIEEKLREVREFVGEGASPLLYRGQADDCWQLTTTLERAGCEGMAFHDYYLLMCRIKSVVETFTLKPWGLPDNFHVERLCADPMLGFDLFPEDLLCRRMVHLRHYGFPSPLLDWSYSPYVAAFFAFRNPLPEGGKRSVYVFCEKPHGNKVAAPAGLQMRSVGSYVAGQPRHFRQQSDYTICGSFDRAWRFRSHEELFNTRRMGRTSCGSSTFRRRSGRVFCGC